MTHVLKSGAPAHEFTQEDRRRGGLARAAKLRAQRQHAERAAHRERIEKLFLATLPRLADEELDDLEGWLQEVSRQAWLRSLRRP